MTTGALSKIFFVAMLLLATAAQADSHAEARDDDAKKQQAPVTGTDTKSQESTQVVYVPPSRGSTRTRTGGGTRGPASAPTLAVLAPDHVGVTHRAQPTLAWFLSAPTEGRIDLALVDPDAVEPLLEVTLPSPNEAGVQLVDLSRYGVSLAQGHTYEWSVALVIDPDNRDLDVVASGAIRREAVPAGMRSALTKGTPAYVTLARAGVWYDALAELSNAIAENPGAAHLHGQRAALLEQVGVGAAAAYERQKGSNDGSEGSE
jgi:hypothetical protein